MGEFRLAPRAQRDLEGIFDYKMAQWGLAQAVHYTDLIEAAYTGLASAQLRAQDCGGIRPGYAVAPWNSMSSISGRPVTGSP
jgi:toxin ParE1/3/4